MTLIEAWRYAGGFQLLATPVTPPGAAPEPELVGPNPGRRGHRVPPQTLGRAPLGARRAGAPDLGPERPSSAAPRPPAAQAQARWSTKKT